LPLTRSPPCNDYGKAEKSAVDEGGHQREKICHLSNEINAVDGSTGETAKIGPTLSSDPWGAFSRWPEDGLDLPASLDRRYNGNNVTPLDRQCPLGPGGDGDSLDDLA